MHSAESCPWRILLLKTGENSGHRQVASRALQWEREIKEVSRTATLKLLLLSNEIIRRTFNQALQHQVSPSPLFSNAILYAPHRCRLRYDKIRLPPATSRGYRPTCSTPAARLSFPATGLPRPFSASFLPPFPASFGHTKPRLHRPMPKRPAILPPTLAPRGPLADRSGGLYRGLAHALRSPRSRPAHAATQADQCPHRLGPEKT